MNLFFRTLINHSRLGLSFKGGPMRARVSYVVHIILFSWLWIGGFVLAGRIGARRRKSKCLEDETIACIYGILGNGSCVWLYCFDRSDSFSVAITLYTYNPDPSHFETGSSLLFRI